MINFSASEALTEGNYPSTYFFLGKCRVLRKFIERYFAANVARFCLVSSHLHAAQFAHNVNMMKYASALAERTLEGTPYENDMHFSLENVNLQTGTMDLVVRVSFMPDTTEGCLSFLDYLGAGLRRAQSVAQLHSARLGVEGFMHDVLDAGTPDKPNDIVRYLTQFTKLVEADYSEIRNTPAYLVSLAEHLQPGVTPALNQLHAQYDAAIEATFAQLAQMTIPKRNEELFAYVSHVSPT